MRTVFEIENTSVPKYCGWELTQPITSEGVKEGQSPVSAHGDHGYRTLETKTFKDESKQLYTHTIFSMDA